MSRPAWINDTLVLAAALIHANTGHSVSLSITDDAVVFHRSTRDGLDHYSVHRNELRDAMAATIATIPPEPTNEVPWPTLPDLSTDEAIAQTYIEPIVEADPFYNPRTNNVANSGRVTPAVASPLTSPAYTPQDTPVAFNSPPSRAEEIVYDLNTTTAAPVPHLPERGETREEMVTALLTDLAWARRTQRHRGDDRRHKLHVAYRLGFHEARAPRSFNNALARHQPDVQLARDIRKCAQRAYCIGQQVGLERLYHSSTVTLRRLQRLTVREYQRDLLPHLEGATYPAYDPYSDGHESDDTNCAYDAALYSN